MSTIGGIGGGGNQGMMQGMHGMRRPPGDGQKMAENLYAQIDTSGQGYIDKSTLQAAFDKVAPAGSSSASGTTNVDELFSRLDGNSDGKVTKGEFTDTLKQLTQQLRNSEEMQGARNMPPPPPPPPGGGGGGLSKDQLTEINQSGTADSALSSLIANFDQADTNGDGKVSAKEAMAFEQSTSSSSDSLSSTSTGSTATTSPSSTETENAKVMKQIMQLMSAYDIGPSKEGSLSLLA